MSNTSDYNLANQVGSSFRAELNTVLGDVQSLNSGSSDPSTTVAYKIWVDTSTNLLKISFVVGLTCNGSSLLKSNSGNNDNCFILFFPVN